MIPGFDSVSTDVDVEATLTDEERKQRLDDLTALIDMIRPGRETGREPARPQKGDRVSFRGSDQSRSINGSH